MKKLMFVTVLALVALAVAVAFTQAPGGGARPRMMGPARGGGFPLKLIDTDQDGKITHQEWVDAFKKIDSDGNGIVTKEELENFRQKLREETRKKMFEKMDADGNGTVTKEEFESFRQKSREEAQKRMFEKLDADGSGTISKEEFPGPDNRFDKIDANSDGELTPEELKEAAEKLHKMREELREKGRGKGPAE